MGSPLSGVFASPCKATARFLAVLGAAATAAPHRVRFWGAPNPRPPLASLYGVHTPPCRRHLSRNGPHVTAFCKCVNSLLFTFKTWRPSANQWRGNERQLPIRLSRSRRVLRMTGTYGASTVVTINGRQWPGRPSRGVFSAGAGAARSPVVKPKRTAPRLGRAIGVGRLWRR